MPCIASRIAGEPQWALIHVTPPAASLASQEASTVLAVAVESVPVALVEAEKGAEPEPGALPASLLAEGGCHLAPPASELSDEGSSVDPPRFSGGGSTGSNRTQPEVTRDSALQNNVMAIGL